MNLKNSFLLALLPVVIALGTIVTCHGQRLDPEQQEIVDTINAQREAADLSSRDKRHYLPSFDDADIKAGAIGTFSRITINRNEKPDTNESGVLLGHAGPTARVKVLVKIDSVPVPKKNKLTFENLADDFVFRATTKTARASFKEVDTSGYSAGGIDRPSWNGSRRVSGLENAIGRISSAAARPKVYVTRTKDLFVLEPIAKRDILVWQRRSKKFADLTTKPRVWESAGGTHRIEAVYVSRQGNMAKLQTAEGKVIEVDIEKLAAKHKAEILRMDPDPNDTQPQESESSTNTTSSRKPQP